MTGSCRRGYTLAEILVATVVLTTGGLGLAAGSAIVARELRTNAGRAKAASMAASRVEIVRSACRIAGSGSETRGAISSEWTISPLDSARLRLTGTVSYPTARARRDEPFSATIACR